MAQRSKTTIAAELAEIEREIAACDAETAANYERRLRLLEEGLDAGMTVGELASLGGQREGTYRQALYKARQRASA